MNSNLNSNMVFCQACGKQMHVSARTCPQCGAIAPVARGYEVQNSTVNGFTDAIKVCFQKYAVFQGRASRSEFWYFFLFSWLVGFALQILIALAYSSATMMAFLGFVAVIFGLGMLIPSLSVAVRRMHDVDKSGWFVLLYMGGVALVYVAIMLWAVAAIEGSTGGGLMGFLVFVAGIALIIWQIVLFCSRGTMGPNRFGGPTVRQ